MNTTTLRLKIVGEAKPQGSKTGYLNPKTGRIILTEASKALKPWRDHATKAMKLQAKDAGWIQLEAHEPVIVKLTFGMKAPAKKVRELPTTKPDLDKLIRAMLDAVSLAGNIWADDSQVVELQARKVYAAQPAVLMEVQRVA